MRLCTGDRDPPPSHDVGAAKHILVGTLDKVANPTRCPQPVALVPLMTSYIV